MSAPLWLKDEPELRALLDAVLDRFDKQPGEKRQQSLYFSAEEYLPTLKQLDNEADQLWHFVHMLQAERLLTIKEDRKRSPYDADWNGARLAFSKGAEETLRAWLERPREKPVLQHWRDTVARHADAFPGSTELLLKRRIVIPGWDDEETIAALVRLSEINTPTTLRQVSARLFAGDSKRLDDKEELIRALFPELPIKLRSLVIAVHLPGDYRGVLFIENQDSYANAVAGAYPDTENLALVYAAGFRGSAERIREKDAALLHYSGVPSGSNRFAKWWFNEEAEQPGPLYFFGDLDFSGMAILSSLRRRFSTVTSWQPGYAALLEQLKRGQGHLPDDAGKQLQIDPGTTGCTYADTVLLPATRRLGFVDQEAFIANPRE